MKILSVIFFYLLICLTPQLVNAQDVAKGTLEIELFADDTTYIAFIDQKCFGVNCKTNNLYFKSEKPPVFNDVFFIKMYRTVTGELHCSLLNWEGLTLRESIKFNDKDLNKHSEISRFKYLYTACLDRYLTW